MGPSKTGKKFKKLPKTPEMEKKKKKSKGKSSPVVEVGKADRSTKRLSVDWDKEELQTLVDNIYQLLPKNDIKKYTTSTDRLDWDKVAFNDHTPLECKEQWMKVCSNLRKYRTMTEMVADARNFASKPWKYGSKKIRHPDLPKKPLTPFFRYFMERRDQIKSDGTQITEVAKLVAQEFQALSDKKKKKYKDLYEAEMVDYRIKLEKFRQEHPDVPINQREKHSDLMEGPKKPESAFHFFQEYKMSKLNDSAQSKKSLLEDLRKQWSELPEGKKIKWIRKADADNERYLNEIEAYIKLHPDFKPRKATLTKAEKELKEKFDGKPEKPPSNGYGLFTRLMVGKIKEGTTKEKMSQLAQRWKELSAEERQKYNFEAKKLTAKYVEEMENYLKSLPQEDREKVTGKSKRKLTEVEEDEDEDDAEDGDEDDAEDDEEDDAEDDDEDDED